MGRDSIHGGSCLDKFHLLLHVGSDKLGASPGMTLRLHNLSLGGLQCVLLNKGRDQNRSDWSSGSRYYITQQRLPPVTLIATFQSVYDATVPLW